MSITLSAALLKVLMTLLAPNQLSPLLTHQGLPNYVSVDFIQSRNDWSVLIFNKVKTVHVQVAHLTVFQVAKEEDNKRRGHLLLLLLI